MPSEGGEMQPAQAEMQSDEAHDEAPPAPAQTSASPMADGGGAPARTDESARASRATADSRMSRESRETRDVSSESRGEPEVPGEPDHHQPPPDDQPPPDYHQLPPEVMPGATPTGSRVSTMREEEELAAAGTAAPEHPPSTAIVAGSSSAAAASSAASADVDAETNELLQVQIRAIMLQHAEDLKRMQPSDAGRLAMESMAELRTQRAASAASLGVTYVV